MSYRITHRPFAASYLQPKDRSWAVSAPRKKPGVIKTFKPYGHDDQDTLVKLEKAFALPLPKLPKQAKTQARQLTEQRKAETNANQGYRSGFVLMDLTDTPAHSARLAAMSDIADHHAELEKKNVGSGFLFPDEFVASTESHISLVRGVRAPLLHPEDQAAGKEKPVADQLKAFDALTDMPAIKLALADHISYWPGPANGPPRYMVAAININDPSKAMPAMQKAWAQAGGTSVPSNVGMHLTLAYLKLDTARLPESVEKAILQKLEKGVQWEQTEVNYSGRYGKEFAKAELKKT